MEISVQRTRWVDHPTPLLVLPSFEGDDAASGALGELSEALEGQLRDVLARGDYRGKEGQTLVLYPRPGSQAFDRLLLVGLGKRGEVDLERIRRAGGTAAKQAAKYELDRFSIVLPGFDEIEPGAAGRAFSEGVGLGAYLFDEFKSKEGPDAQKQPLTRAALLEADEPRAAALEEAVRVGSALASGECFARTLGNLPGNVATPDYLAERAREFDARFGMKVTVLGPAELEKEGLRTLLAVSRGSAEEPRLIVLEHRRGRGGPPIALVGKGLTFDSGGISIKPAAGMEEMKFDMCGGAAVLGAMHAIGELQIPIDIVAVVPAAENLLSGSAMKPGDIIRSHGGKTIEVVNTDAEGRLILADALSYVRRFEPAAVVDVATLTGSCVMALGHHASAIMGNDEGLLQEVRGAGDRVAERVWPMPMFQEYREQIKSEYADIKNSGGRPAGAITAGWFLREFVGDTPWVHLDIAGTAYGDGKLSYQTKGATGVPTRLLVEWVLSRAG
ncbi:MAG TPA: leucyl aminopeptidase [Longimicrobiaceae bacterium]|nr:leucyl aminopeptidase [Longimicrobiaceae bacterium]